MTARAKSYKRGKTFAPEVRLTPGPRAMGDTGDGSYQTLYGYAWAAVLDRAERRFRLFQAQVPGEGPWPLNDPRGPEAAVWVEVEVPPLPHPVDEIAHMGVAFDQAARHVVVYERQGEVWIRQWDPVTQQFVMRGPFPGHDPVVLNDAVVGYFPPDSDVLVWHLTPDRKTLVQRVQRQLYATAQVVQTFQEPVVLDQAVALPFQIELLGSLLGTPDITGYALRSALYPVRVEDALGQAALAAPTQGAYIPIVIVQDMGTDALGQASLSAPTEGAYIPIVIVLDLGTEALGTANLSAPLTGVYVPVVLVHDLGTDAIGQATLSAPTTGSYSLVVVVVDTTTQPGYTSPDLLGTATLSAPTTGSYEPA
ncbi:hypothetical protein KZX47_11835 [Thermus sp. SYSU G05001]|uniref:Uncharacterized protein n=1 Tax=Thermus brevis TaxID=2862456 RepID=A0ABS7A0J2_9DEIN|nr:hypothetical protein [Thermus brevis]MBW6395834.1 hypothetical protein [Thermus brevis]